MNSTWLGAAVVILFVSGCAAEATPLEPSTAHVAQPEVVAVDFFNQSSTPVAACSGTLLAPRVVMTAGHCVSSAQNSYVRAPDAKGQSAHVTTALRYDSQHDIALLVLDKQISISHFPKLWSHAADGLDAIQSHRHGGAAYHAFVAYHTVSIGSSDNALTLDVPDATGDIGGPLFGQDDNGNREVIGMMLGHGSAARVTDSDVRSWIAGVIANPDAMTKPASPPAHAHMETFSGDDDDSDFGSSNDGWGSWVDGSSSSNEADLQQDLEDESAELGEISDIEQDTDGAPMTFIENIRD